jgi:(p)ppGpp synthase/HD superfamily hydrolase
VSNIDLLNRAEEVAKSYHQGQMYGDKDYFSGHIEDVISETADLLNKYFKTDTDCINVLCVAALHDVLEDTDCSVDYLDLYFPVAVVEAVVLLSKNLSATNYLENIKNNKYAKVVKIADSRFNMNQCIKQGDYNRAKKYLKNLCYLESTT